MANYAGETYTVTHTATIDGTALVAADVDAVTIEIFTIPATGDPEVVVAQTAMTWDVVQLRWEYVWDTSGLDPGTYRARIVIDGAGSTENWEYKKIRLARNPVEV